MLRTSRRQTTIAPARSSARHSSRPDRANAPRGSALSTESALARAPAPARSDLLPRSLRHSPCRALRIWRVLIGLRGLRFRAVIVLPVALLLQRIRDFLGHVSLVMFGE